MTQIAITACGIAVFCLCMCQWYNLKIMKSQSKRIRDLELLEQEHERTKIFNLPR